MKLKLLAVAAVAALSSVSSFATTTPWGVHDPVEVGSLVVSPGAFLDIFTFTIPGSSTLSSTAVAANVSLTAPPMVILSIVGGTYSLWSNPDGIVGNGDDTTMGAWSWGFNGTSGSTTNTVSPLAAGAYYYTVGGLAAGSAGGQYTLVSTVTAVPEPETYAMMLAGLGALGFLARRRQS